MEGELKLAQQAMHTKNLELLKLKGALSQEEQKSRQVWTTVCLYGCSKEPHTALKPSTEFAYPNT